MLCSIFYLIYIQIIFQYLENKYYKYYNLLIIKRIETKTFNIIHYRLIIIIIFNHF